MEKSAEFLLLKRYHKIEQEKIGSLILLSNEKKERKNYVNGVL